MSGWNDFPATSGGVDPRLEAAMQKKGNHPREVAALQAEYDDQMKNGYAGVRYGGEKSTSAESWDEFPEVKSESWDAFPATEKEGWDAFPETKDVQVPGTLSRGAQFLTGIAGDTVDAAANIGASVADYAASAVSGFGPSPITDYTDPIRKFGGDVSDRANELILSKEEQAAGDTFDKVTGNVTGMAPLFLLGKAVAPALGGVATFKTGKAAIDAGEDVSTAVQAGLVQGATNALGVALPAYGTTKAGTVALAAANPVLGAIGDYVTQKLVEDEELKKAYDPFDPVNRWTDVIVGGAIGAKGYHGGKAARQALEVDKKLKELADKGDSDLFENMEKISSTYLKVNEIKSLREGEETWEDVWTNKVLTGRFEWELEAYKEAGREDPNNLRPNINTAQVLEVLMHVGETPEVRAKARHLFNMAGDVGLDKAAFFAIKDWADPETAGAHNRNSDTVALDISRTEAMADIKSATLHEIQHAFHGRMLDTLEQISFKRMSQEDLDKVLSAEEQQTRKLSDKTLNKAEQRLVDQGAVEAYEKFAKFHEYLKKRVQIDGGDPKDMDQWYGLLNLKEAFSELFTDGYKRDFVGKLRNMPFNSIEIEQYNPKLNMEMTNQFNELSNVLRQSSDMKPSNALDMMIQHYFNVVGHNSFLLRSQRTKQVREGRQTVLKRRKDVDEQFNKVKEEEGNTIEILETSPQVKYLWRQLYNALSNAKSFDNFITQARLASDSPLWHKYLERNGQTIYDRSGFFIEPLRQASGYKDLSDPERLLGFDNRTPWEFIRDEIKGAGKDAEDISSAGTNIHNPNVLRRLKSTAGFAGRAMKFIIDKAEQKHFWGDKLYHEMKVLSKEYDDLPRSEKIKVFNVISHYDSYEGRQVLLRQKLQWPSADMLKGHGLNDTQIKSYDDLTKAMDRAYDLLNQSHRMNYNEDLPKLAGYMPHFHDGAYKVFLTKKVDGKDLTVVVKGFNNARSARAYAKHALKNGFGVEKHKGEVFRVNKYDDITSPLMSSYREHTNAAANLERLGSAGLMEIQRVETDSMRDFVKHYLERSGVGGFTGEHGAKPDSEAGLREKVAYHVFHKSKALELHDRYFKAVSEAWKNAMFLHNDFAPLMSIDTGYMNGQIHRGDLFENLPNTYKYISKFGYNFLGKNVNHFGLVDDTIRSLSVKLGVDPGAYRRFARGTRNLLSLIKLRVNPANYWNNAVQPIHTISWLSYTDATTGYKGPGAIEAFHKLMQNNYKPDAEMTAALAYARENRILDPQLEYELSSKKKSNLGKVVHAATLGGINPVVEQFGRTQSFMIAFEHYRTQFGGDVVRARESAQLAMQQVMVNYDRISRPLMYQDFGVMGELISPFAVFRNAYIGNSYLMLKLIKDNPTKIAAYTPFIMSNMTFLALAGAVGMIGAGEYNMFVDAVNNFLPGDAELEHLEDKLMRAGAPDWVTFGGASDLTRLLPGMEEGVYVGSAGSAVGVDDMTNAALAPFVKAVASLGGLSVKAVGSTLFGSVPPNATDVYKAGKQLIPGVLSGHYDELFQSEGSDVVFTSTGLEGIVERTPAGRRALDIGGRLSLDEFKGRSVERAVKRSEGLKKKAIASLVQSAADLSEGIYSPLTLDEIRTKASGPGYDLTADEFMEQVINEINDRRLTARQKDAKQAAKGSLPAHRRLQNREAIEGSK